MRVFVFTPVLLLLALIQGCKMINPSESIPTYLYLDSAVLQSLLPATHGSVSHKITDVWVYHDLELLGAFQLPAKVPILATKRSSVQLVAGIWEDGLSGIRAKYPFFTIDTFSFDPSPGKALSHTPKFYYRVNDSAAVKYILEDFEQGNSFEPRYGDTSFVKTDVPSEVFEGNFSSKLVLSDTAKKGESITVESYTLPTNRMCYLELNYKADIPFALRVLVNQNGSQTTIDLTGINANSQWGKIYYNFGGFPSTFQGATFRFILVALLPDDKTQGTVLVDNFKIIHFQ